MCKKLHNVCTCGRSHFFQKKSSTFATSNKSNPLLRRRQAGRLGSVGWKPFAYGMPGALCCLLFAALRTQIRGGGGAGLAIRVQLVAHSRWRGESVGDHWSLLCAGGGQADAVQVITVPLHTGDTVRYCTGTVHCTAREKHIATTSGLHGRERICLPIISNCPHIGE